jgi:hypothetical protein
MLHSLPSLASPRNARATAKSTAKKAKHPGGHAAPCARRPDRQSGKFLAFILSFEESFWNIERASAVCLPVDAMRIEAP